MSVGRKRKTGQENAPQSLLMSALPWCEHFHGNDHRDNLTLSRTVLWGRILEKLDRHFAVTLKCILHCCCCVPMGHKLTLHRVWVQQERDLTPAVVTQSNEAVTGLFLAVPQQ